MNRRCPVRAAAGFRPALGLVWSGVAALLVATALSDSLASQQADVWVAFRYDADRVLFYPATFVDPVLRHDHQRLALDPPIARGGAGGYLLPLTPDRLATFQPATPERSAAATRGVPALGTRLRLVLGADREVSCDVERYLEQWGSEGPLVKVGVLAKVVAADLAAFMAVRSDYFLLGEARLVPPLDLVPRPVQWERTEVVNRFGGRGEIRVESADAGWCVTLYVPADGRLQPSAVRYCYGD